MGVNLPIRVWTDSSAALGICSRQGLGKLRHIDTHTLWVQQAVRSRRIEGKKIPGDRNPADLLTKHSLSAERVKALVELHGCKFIGGRAANAPTVKTGGDGKIKIGEADDRHHEEQCHVGGTTRWQKKGGSVSIDRAGPAQWAWALPPDMDEEAEKIYEVEVQEWSDQDAARKDDVAEEPPLMPHTALSKEALDKCYPSLQAVGEVSMEDLTRLEDDTMYAQGMTVVQKILREMSVHGRTRYEHDVSNGEENAIMCITDNFQWLLGNQATGDKWHHVAEQGGGMSVMPEKPAALAGPCKDCHDDRRGTGRDDGHDSWYRHTSTMRSTSETYGGYRKRAHLHRCFHLCPIPLGGGGGGGGRNERRARNGKCTANLLCRIRRVALQPHFLCPQRDEPGCVNHCAYSHGVALEKCATQRVLQSKEECRDGRLCTRVCTV